MSVYFLAIRLEFTKFYATRLWWLIAIVAVVSVSFIGLVVTSSIAGAGQPPAGGLGYAFSVAGRVGYLFPLLVSALFVTGEYRYSTISQFLIVGIPRSAVVVGKLVNAVAYSLVLGVIVSAVSGLAVAYQFGQSGVDSKLDAVDQYMILVRTPLDYALWAIVGVSLGFIFRNQVAAIIVVLSFTLIVEPVLTTTAREASWFAGVGKFLPGAASLSLVWPPDTKLQSVLKSLSAVEGGLVFLTYAVVALLAAFLLFRYREVRE